MKEVSIGRTAVPDQPRLKKIHNRKNWEWWCTPVTPAMVGIINRRITVQASPDKK
jgi:hypothetical protein